MENPNWLKRVPEQKCPTCGHILNAVVEAGTVAPAMPQEDDITMCVKCRTPLLFNKDLSMRLLNKFEKEALGELIKEMANHIASLKRGRR